MDAQCAHIEEQWIDSEARHDGAVPEDRRRASSHAVKVATMHRLFQAQEQRHREEVARQRRELEEARLEDLAERSWSNQALN